MTTDIPPEAVVDTFEKIQKGQIALDKEATAIVAIGPDVADPSALDAASLMKVRVADQAVNWRQNGITIPSQWWRNWLGFLICLSGKAQRCRRLEQPTEIGDGSA